MYHRSPQETTCGTFCYDSQMISHLRGRVIDKSLRYCILDVGGVGYKVFATDDALKNLQITTPEAAGLETSFYTYMVVRETALDLYGFADLQSLGLFELLINISGIGPKTGLGIMNVVSPQTLSRAVSSGDLAYLTKVSGIGRKLAEKIILELREKLDEYGSDGAAETEDLKGETDALEALKSLGYSERESREALKKIADEHKDEKVGAAEKIGKNNKTELSAGDKVKKALKILGGPGVK